MKSCLGKTKFFEKQNSQIRRVIGESVKELLGHYFFPYCRWWQCPVDICFDAINQSSVLWYFVWHKLKVHKRSHIQCKTHKKQITYKYLVGLECWKETGCPWGSLSCLIKLKSFAQVVSRCFVAFKCWSTATWSTWKVCCRDAACEQRYGVSLKAPCDQNMPTFAHTNSASHSRALGEIHFQRPLVAW